MTHPSRTLADQVAAALEAAELSQGVAIVRKLLPPTDLKSPTASVYAGPLKREQISRRDWSTEPSVYVALQQAIPAGVDELDFAAGLLDLAHELAAACIAATWTNATLLAVDDDAETDAYNAEQLRNTRKFTTLLTLRFAV